MPLEIAFGASPSPGHFEADFRAFTEGTTEAGSSVAGEAPRLKEGGSWRKRAGCWRARRAASQRAYEALQAFAARVAFGAESAGKCEVRGERRTARAEKSEANSRGASEPSQRAASPHTDSATSHGRSAVPAASFAPAGVIPSPIGDCGPAAEVHRNRRKTLFPEHPAPANLRENERPSNPPNPTICGLSRQTA